MPHQTSLITLLCLGFGLAMHLTYRAELAADVYVEPAVLGYLNQIVSATRGHKHASLGVSMRGALALARAIKTWALSQGRNYVTPDDVRELAIPVLAHRIMVDPEADFAGISAADIISGVIADIEPPVYRAA